MIVEVAADCAAARRCLAVDPSYDVIVVDEWLPDGSGFELARELESTRRGAMRLVGYSLMTGADTRGLDTVIRKPVRPAALVRALEQVFEGELREAPSGTAQMSEWSGTAAREPLRILLAEDNSVNQRVAQLMLARLGYQAVLARDGAEAVAAVERQTFDLILMDVQMPVMGGIEAARVIRAAPTSRSQPRIVALTAGALTSDRQQALAAGMDDFLTKPIRFETLQAALARTFAQLRPTHSRVDG